MSTPARKPTKTPAALERDIEQTRAQLADTVEELAHKVNVPARVKDTMHQASDTAQTKATQLKHQAQAATTRIAAKTQELSGQALAKLPPPVRRRPVPTAAIAVAVVVVLWALLRNLRHGTRS